LLASQFLFESNRLILWERAGKLERAVRIDPASGEAALELGLARLEMNEAQAAMDELRRSQPLLANLGTYVAIGNAQMALGQLDEACASFRQAIALHPAYFRAHMNLVEALRRKGDLLSAREHLNLARETWPGHPQVAEATTRLQRAEAEQAQ
jgi:tetratricopeptide (TPR) repeat protein